MSSRFGLVFALAVPLLFGAAHAQSPQSVRVRGTIVAVEGPVLTVRSFTDDDDALRQANDTEYGLAASAWTRDVYRAQRASREINAGCVWINDHIPIISEMPHGGCKASGFGKDMSAYSFDEYTQVKHVMSALSPQPRKDWHDVIVTSRPEEHEGGHSRIMTA